LCALDDVADPALSSFRFKEGMDYVSMEDVVLSDRVGREAPESAEGAMRIFKIEDIRPSPTRPRVIRS
jgi:hypothetical protein